MVNYSVSGTATSGSDFLALRQLGHNPQWPGFGERNPVPIDDSVGEANETVSPDDFTECRLHRRLAQRATVTITDNEPTITVTASEAAAEQGPATRHVHHHANQHQWQSGRQLHDHRHGHATNGSDFSAIASSVTIASGRPQPP